MDPSKILILADESANWKIAGLRQLERLVLAVNEFAEEMQPEGKIDIFVFWRPTIAAEECWVPQNARLNRCDLHLADGAEDSGPPRLLSTHLLLKRGGLSDFISTAPELEPKTAIVDRTQHWESLDHIFANVCREAGRLGQVSGWRYLNAPAELAAAERWFLRDSGKPQDGFVSRLINRPISRSISRVLLKSRVTPGAWTLSIFAFPIVAFVLLQRGDYLGFVSGAALFQLYSVLDGCDGEVARAKYLESESGRRFDTLCDILGSLLFVIGLGVGLYQLHQFDSSIWLYLGEGILCSLMIAANEWLLRNPKIETDFAPNALTSTFYVRHRAMIQRSGVLFLGEKLVWWLFQLTKRDIAIFLFLLLAIAARPQWILHLWIIVTAVSLLLAVVARLRARADRFRVRLPASRS